MILFRTVPFLMQEFNLITSLKTLIATQKNDNEVQHFTELKLNQCATKEHKCW
jgi:hypothetical protein